MKKREETEGVPSLAPLHVPNQCRRIQATQGRSLTNEMVGGAAGECEPSSCRARRCVSGAVGKELEVGYENQ